MNLKLSFSDVNVMGNAHVGEAELTVDYTAEELIAVLKVYPELISAILKLQQSA